MDLTGHTSTTQYIFPILRLSDIIHCLSELEIELTKAELAEPHRHKEKVKQVFLQLTEICCGLSEADYERKSDNLIRSVEACSHPEVHDDFAELKFFVALRKYMRVCGVYDFGWRDLHAPTTKRLRCQLSAAINMAKYREEELKLYAELIAPRTELLMALDEVNDENKALNVGLESAQQESNEKYKEMTEIEQECGELELEIARNNKLQASRREEATELKKKHNELKDQLATSKLALQEKQADHESLLARIVTSPDRRKKEIEDLNANLKQERSEVKALEEKARKCKSGIVHVKQLTKDVQETSQQAHTSLDIVRKICDVQEEIETKQSDLEGLQRETDTILEQNDEAERTLGRVEERLSHMRKQSKIKMEAAQDSIDSAKSQLLEAEREHLEGIAKVEAGEAEVKGMEAQIDEERKRAQEEVNEMIALFQEAERQFVEKNEKFIAAIEAA